MDYDKNENIKFYQRINLYKVPNKKENQKKIKKQIFIKIKNQNKKGKTLN
jgi:hypothetical protein